jgi:hypothetical protein
VVAGADLVAVALREGGKMIKRIIRHLLSGEWQTGRLFPQQTLNAIEQEIIASESAHAGEIRFVIECGLGITPLFKGFCTRERSIDVFSQLRMWDTDHRNGVLIYLLLADHSVEIVADRGVHPKIGTPEWEKICRDMETEFRQGRYESGAVAGIKAITHHLTQHFPALGPPRNALINKVVIL